MSWLGCEAVQYDMNLCYSANLADFPHLGFDPGSEVPLYKQIAERVTEAIENGSLRPGQRLPATRELAGVLGVNRTTVSAAYTLLEDSGIIYGHVGRGSFVAEPVRATDYEGEPKAFGSNPDGFGVNFASSRPAREAFPLSEFRRLSKAVIDSNEASEILQLGSPYGYGPLRRYLLAGARREGIGKPDDD